MTFERFEVVVVPFPFADRVAARRRPALVVSTPQSLGCSIGHSVLAMITSADNPPWPLDVPITNLEAAGLSHPSVVRMKLFTLDERLVLRAAGSLMPQDAGRVTEALAELLGIASWSRRDG